MPSLFYLVLALYALPNGGRAAPEDLSTREILDRALEVQRLNRESGDVVKFDYEILNVTEKLTGDGEIDEVEERLFVSKHVEDVPYERLVRKDGRELTTKELEDEDEREKEFREKLAKRRRDGKEEDDEDHDSVEFDEKLVSRYDVVLDGVESLSGRDCYVLSYSPRSGPLPNDKRIDRVLNKSSGRMWVDTESYEIARVDFALNEKVKLWLGLIGSISEMTGRLERRPVAKDVWLPHEFDLYLKGRIVFRALHLREKVEWKEFKPRSQTLP